MNKKSNHPFQLQTRMSVCNNTKLNSIIDAASHGGVTPSYLTSESFEEGMLNDLANWDQTLLLIDRLPERVKAEVSPGVLGSLIFSSESGEVGIVFRLEEKSVISDAVSASMFFDDGGDPKAVVVLTLGVDLIVDLLTLVSKVASLSAMVHDKSYRPSTDKASLYSDLMAILVTWRVKNQFSSSGFSLRVRSRGFSHDGLAHPDDLNHDVAIAGVGTFSPRIGRFPAIFMN